MLEEQQRSLWENQSIIMSLADTLSVSSLSRRLGTRTFCGEWIQDLKRSLVGFCINNDTNTKRLRSSRPENRVKSSYPTRPLHSEGASLWLWSAPFWVGHLLCTHKITKSRQKNDGRRSNISERNFTGKGGVERERENISYSATKDASDNTLLSR